MSASRAPRRSRPGAARLAQALRRTVDRFTPMGKILILGYAGTMIFVGDTRTTVNFRLFGLLLTLLSTAVLFSLFTRTKAAHFRVERTLPGHGDAGLPLSYALKLENLSPRTQAGLQVADIPHAEQPGPLPRMDAVPADPVRPGGRVVVNASFTPARRGLFRFSGVTLAWPDPLNLFKAVTFLNQEQTLLVLPRRYPLPPVRLLGRRHAPMEASPTSYSEGEAGLPGDSGDFISLRDYRQGDPLKKVHWRCSAKHQKLIVKEFQCQDPPPGRALVLDTFPGPQPGSGADNEERFEAAVVVAASIAAAQGQRQPAPDLLLMADKEHTSRLGRGLSGQAPPGPLLEALALAKVSRDAVFPVLAQSLLARAETLGGCMIVFTSWDDQRRNLALELKRRGVPLLLAYVALPGEKAPEPDGLRLMILRTNDLEQGLARL